MTSQQIEHVEKQLIHFVDRVVKKDATAAEVEALPAVAEVLLCYFSSGISDSIS